MSDLIPVYVNWQSDAAWVGNYRLTVGRSKLAGWCWHVDLFWPDNHISTLAEGRECGTAEEAKSAAKHALCQVLHGDPKATDEVKHFFPKKRGNLYI